VSPQGRGGGYGRRVPDPVFAPLRLAPLYDAFDGDRGDLGAYVAITREVGAGRVLDVGCGTGSLAVLLARAGLTVTGLDVPARQPGWRRTSRAPGGVASWLVPE
jgi:SAM-dependent methyltransferase